MIKGDSRWMKVGIMLPFLAVGCPFQPAVQAAGWTTAVGLSINQSYTDNADLDAEEKSESITSISPSISIYRQGARAKVDLSYAPEYRQYWHETADDEVIHFLGANGNVEFVKHHFFLDAAASADQRTINSSGRTGIGGRTGTDDLTQTYTLYLSPYFQSHLGRSNQLEVRYGFDKIDYSEDDAEGSTGHSVNVLLSSVPGVTGPYSWNLLLEQSRVEYDDRDGDDKTRQVRGDLAYKLNNKWSLTGQLGYEDFELVEQEDESGQVWNVGFVFTPNTRTRLAAGGGERAFGNDYYLDFSHRSRRTVWNASYHRDFVSARDEVRGTNRFPREDEFGNLIEDPTAITAAPVLGGSPTLNTEQYVLRQFTTSFTLSTGRTTASLGAGYTERDYTETVASGDTKDMDLSLNFSRQIRPRTDGFLLLSWNDHDEQLADYKEWLASLGGSYRLGPHTNLGLTLAHLDRDASVEADSYQENSASLSLSTRW